MSLEDIQAYLAGLMQQEWMSNNKYIIDNEFSKTANDKFYHREV